MCHRLSHGSKGCGEAHQACERDEAKLHGDNGTVENNTSGLGELEIQSLLDENLTAVKMD